MNILHNKRLAYLRRRRIFARFAHNYEQEIKEIANNTVKGRELIEVYNASAVVLYDVSRLPHRRGLPHALQLIFHAIPCSRQDYDGNWLSEGGLSIVYGIGPTGHVSVTLYPFHTEVHRPLEESIVLDIIDCNEAKLRKIVPRNIKDLISYGYVTALDTEPTLMQRFRIWWLRLSKATHKEQEYTPAQTAGLIDKLKMAGLSGVASGALRFATPFLLGLLTAWLGRKFS